MAWQIYKIILMTTLTVNAILVFVINIPHTEARNVRIAAVISYKGAPFDETLEGFQRHLQKQGISVDYDLYPLEGDPERVSRIIQKIKSSRPSLIFTLGSLATEATLKEIDDIPIIVSMILRADLLKKASNATGIFLEFPVETQFKWLERFLPNTKTVGVIYNPKENQERVESAGKVAQKMGMSIQAKEVRVPQDLPEALNGLSKNVDVLWGVADNLVLNSQTAKHILLFSFRNLIPFIGLSSAWVKAGALYSLESDYTDNGTQCGEIAFRVLQGAKVNSIPPSPPRKVVYSLNLNTARHMKVKISDELLRGAQQTF